jgi:competence protein ComEA
MLYRNLRNSLRNVISVFGLVVLLVTQSAFAAPESVNVNSADAETLALVLDGVGMVRAEAIVEYRTRNGRFAEVYDLAHVKGIGDRTIELNEERIRLQD